MSSQSRDGIPVSDSQLLELVRSISAVSFGQPFRHKSRYNTRLRSVAGRYLLVTHDLEFSHAHAVKFGRDDLVKTILHELCHYHLHLQGAGYRHRDREFKELLAEVGGSRYARALQPRVVRPIAHRYICTQCAIVYERRRSLDTTRFVCGVCKGKLDRLPDSAL